MVAAALLQGLLLLHKIKVKIIHNKNPAHKITLVINQLTTAGANTYVTTHATTIQNAAYKIATQLTNNAAVWFHSTTKYKNADTFHSTTVKQLAAKYLSTTLFAKQKLATVGLMTNT